MGTGIRPGLFFRKIRGQGFQMLTKAVAQGAELRLFLFGEAGGFSLIILFPVVTAIAKGSQAVNSVPVLGKANRFFGGVFGILNGAISLCVAAIVLRFVISAEIFPEYFSEKIISKTYLFKWIYFTVCENNILM